MKGRILIAEDNRKMRQVLKATLSREGYEVAEAGDGAEALDWLRENRADALISDIRMPRLDGLALFRACRERFPELPVILVTAYGTIGDAVEAMRGGAFDYITKPFDEGEFLRVAGNAVRTAAQEAREAVSAAGDGTWYGMVGRSAAWRDVRKIVEKAATSPFPVLITGDTGTGKELVARAIHAISARRDGPFLKINGAAIPPTLWEAEVFGYEKGAFTGAVTSKPGRFELADGGTFFLDEVGEVAFPLQGKLLRVLQDREFERVGGVKTLTADVRLICASNRDLKKETERGSFREDLYYRINGIPIHLPSLSSRREDILPLAEHFLGKTCAGIACPPKVLSRESRDLLERYAWPGNIRELENAIGRAVALSEGAEIAPSDLCLSLDETAQEAQEKSPAGGGEMPFHASVRGHKRAIIRKAIAAAGGSKTKAAELLRLSPTYLSRLIRVLDVEGP